MQAQNINIKSPINTSDVNTFSAEPVFENKNSLAYQGIVSNMTVKSGDGVLSTTGKTIKIENGVLTAGTQSFSLPLSDYWTVEKVGSKPISDKEVAIKDKVAGTTNKYFYINDTRINWSVEPKETFIVPVHNTESFAALGIGVNSTEIYLDEIKVATFEWKIKEQGGDRPSSLGKSVTATYINNKLIIGFDDDDYRKRGCFEVQSPLNVTDPRSTKVRFYYGFGVVSNKGIVTGEPVPKLFSDENCVSATFNGATIAACGPCFERDNISWRYKVLDNGSISFWNGFFKPTDISSTIYPGRPFIDIIADENAALGTDPIDGGLQIGATNWHWKIHNGGFGVKNSVTPNGQEDAEAYVNSVGNVVVAPTNGANYFYSNTGNAYQDSLGYNTSYPCSWAFGLDLASGGIKAIQMVSAEGMVWSSTNSDAMASCPRSVNILGDWTYGYNSMKSAKDLTDYDGVFPFLRVFFNVVGSRGKYWDYGPGWFKSYLYQFRWMKCSNEILAAHTPLKIYHWDEQQNTLALNKERYISLESLRTSIEQQTANCNNSFNVVEPLGKTHFSNWSADTLTPWRGTYPMTCYSDYFKYSGNIINFPVNEWVQMFDTRGYGFSIMRKIRNKGSGAGLSEEVFNFGGLGDDSLLGLCSETINIDKDNIQTANISSSGWQTGGQYNDLLRLGIYNNLNTTLSFKGTLLFNATDLENKFHITSSGNEYVITIYNDKKVQYCKLVKNGTIRIDKMTDYMFRLNLLGENNLLLETRDGIFSLIKGFNSFIGENRLYVGDLQMSLPSPDVSSNNTLLYADGVNVNLLDSDVSPSFLFPSKTLTSYVSTVDMKYFEDTVLKNRHGFIKNRLRNSNISDSIEVYYTSLLSSADLSYKETDEVPDKWGDFTGLTGIQSWETDMEGNTYWIDSSTVIYPVAIASEISGINYQTSTIDLPGNYAVRFYTQNNKTWPVYNQNAQVYFGNNIFTIMGSNYYFDGQGVYYLGDSRSGATKQYGENILIAYAIGMKYLCNAPSEAYFYSPFDRCLYVFTSSNTMQKAMSLSRFGDILDACYCPVNQALYILFNDKLLIRTQDDMALIDVEGTSLQTTSNGVQVIKDFKYVIHSPYLYDETIDLVWETEWLGTPDGLFKYGYVDVVLNKVDDDVRVELDLLTVAGTNVSSSLRNVTINKKDWQNGQYKVRLTPKEPVGSAFKIVIKSKDRVGIYNATAYMEPASNRTSAGSWV